jgi:hypothetical protein
MKSPLLIGAVLLALTGSALSGMPNLDPSIVPLYFTPGSGRVCLSPNPGPGTLPWWAKPYDARSVLVPLYMCSPPWTGGRGTFQSCAGEYEKCEYEFAISEVMGVCRAEMNGSNSQRCLALISIVAKSNPTFCQSYEDICPSVK